VAERFEHAQLRFLMPNDAGDFHVTGGTLLQVDDSDSVATCYVGVDIQSQSTQTVTVTLDSTNIANEGEVSTPPGPWLQQNFPNPFNPSTHLCYALPATGHVRLAIYTPAGREVAVLVDGVRPGGESTARWDGRDHQGRSVASGLYLARLEIGGKVMSRKVVLAR